MNTHPTLAIALLILFIIICLLLVVVVLLQKGRGGGLGAAFGGAGNAAFGTRTGDVFTWITIVLTAMFLLLAVSATVLVKPKTQTTDNPVFRPDPNTTQIDEPTKVQIVCSTPKVKIYYTLDGSTPTKTSQEFKKFITVQPVPQGVTVKAIAIGEERDPSEVVTAHYGLRLPEPEEPTSRPTTTSAPASRPTSASSAPRTPATAGAPK